MYLHIGYYFLLSTTLLNGNIFHIFLSVSINYFAQVNWMYILLNVESTFNLRLVSKRLFIQNT